MRSPATVTLGIDGSIRLLREVGRIHRTLTRLLLQRCPGIGGPPEIQVAHHVAHTVIRLLVGIGGIDGQYAVHIVLGQTVHLRLILLSRFNLHHSTLVAVVHQHHGNISILTKLIEVIYLIRQHLPVDDGRTAHEVHTSTRERLRIHRTQFGNRVFLKLLHEHTAQHLCLLLRYHTHRRHKGAALTDTGAEKTFSHGRGTKNVTVHGTGRLAEDSHFRGITTEVLDVPLNPLQGEDLIQKTVVA